MEIKGLMMEGGGDRVGERGEDDEAGLEGFFKSIFVDPPPASAPPFPNELRSDPGMSAGVFFGFALRPSARPSAVLAAGHWRSRSSRYRYSKVKPSFFRWPHFS